MSGLAPLLDEGRAHVDRRRAVRHRPAGGRRRRDRQRSGLPVHLLDIDPEDQHRLFYDTVSNETLWFVHHALFDLTADPSFDDDWYDAWAAYRRVNLAFAAAVCELSPPDAVVLVQDYHLTLLAPRSSEHRPDLSLVHFHHTPFAGPDNARVLPTEVLEEMLAVARTRTTPAGSTPPRGRPTTPRCSGAGIPTAVDTHHVRRLAQQRSRRAGPQPRPRRSAAPRSPS